MHRILFLLSFLLPFSFFAAGQNTPAGSVKGRVITRDQLPAAFVSVVVVGTDRSAITDEGGLFTISRVPAGTQELEVSLTGYETLRQKCK